MKNLILAALLLLAGCTSHTQYGECIGINEDKDPKLKYKADIVNVAAGVVFAELIVPPIVVLFNELYCPVGVK